MKGLIVTGCLLALLGIVGFLLPSTVYSDHSSVVTDNMVHKSFTTVTIPTWADALAVGVGVVMVVIGAAARPRYH